MSLKTTYTLSHGFIVDASGSLTTEVGEVIAGVQSIKGSYTGGGAYTPYLHTDTSVLPLSANATYQITFAYRILSKPSSGFEVLFYSPTGGSVGSFLNSTVVTGNSGDSGSASLTSTMGNFSDYQARWNVIGTGAIAIDEIKIVNLATGSTVIYENAEEGVVNADPSVTLLKTGLINDVVKGSELTINYAQYDAHNAHSYYYRSALIADFNQDGSNEILFSVSPYSQYRVPVVVLGNATNALDASGQAPSVQDLTTKYFPGGPPTPMNAESIVYKDINLDGNKDLIFSETGLDSPPWTGAKISVAIANGAGNETTFTDVSSLVPNTSMRTYAIAVGDFTADGTQDILLGDQEVYGSNTWSGADYNQSKLLDFVGGKFVEIPNPIKGWADPKNRLPSHICMTAADFNSDGYDDLLVTNSWSGANATVIYGSKTGLDKTTLERLPAGPLGQGGFDWATTSGKWPLEQVVYGNETRAAVYDFNKDGKLDIFGIQNEYFQYPAGVVTDKTAPNYQDVLLNGGGLLGGKCAFYTLINVDGTTFKVQSSSDAHMPSRFYDKLFCYDINFDGNMDVIGHYMTFARAGDDNGSIFSTTFFLNDGHGNFTAIDGVKALPQLAQFPYAESAAIPKPEVGAIFPIKYENGVFTGLQLFSAPNQTGGYTALEFTTNQMSNLKPEVLAITNPIIATDGTQTIVGTAGVDKLIYANQRANYKVSGSATGFKITGDLVNHTLSNVERIKFADGYIALDVGATQSAGETAMLLGAVLPGKLVFDVSKQALLGAVIDLFDQGFSLQTLSGAVMRLPIWEVLTGKAAPTNTNIASYLLTNVNGVAPDATTLANAVAALDTETSFATQGNYLWHLAESSTNQTHVGLIGLASAGLGYTA